MNPSTSQPPVLARENYQRRVVEWVKACFGKVLTYSKRERAARFAEEAVELCQAAGMSKEEMLWHVEKVYAKEPGEVFQEVGGVSTSLMAFCEAHELDAYAEGEKELERIWTKIDKIRIKGLAKERFQGPEVLEVDGLVIMGAFDSLDQAPENANIGLYIVDNRLYSYTGEAWLEVKQAPPDPGDMPTVMEQIEQFANGRPVRLLTRKANSQKDSAVPYTTVFPPHVKFGTLQIVMRCDEDEVVAAVNVTENHVRFEDHWAKEPVLD